MNDDFNSFEYVIKVLMAILGHNVYQAQQCAEITHNVGKCHIYSALGNDAYFTFEQLTKHGLSVKLTHKKL